VDCPVVLRVEDCDVRHPVSSTVLKTQQFAEIAATPLFRSPTRLLTWQIVATAAQSRSERDLTGPLGAEEWRIKQCSIRPTNLTVLQVRMRNRKIVTARHCRTGPTCVYPAIHDGWRAGARNKAARARSLRSAQPTRGREAPRNSSDQGRSSNGVSLLSPSSAIFTAKPHALGLEHIDGAAGVVNHRARCCVAGTLPFAERAPRESGAGELFH
jgi:hypothetical protein